MADTELKEKKKPVSAAGMMLNMMPQDDSADDSYEADKQALEEGGFKVTGTTESGKPVSASYQTEPLPQEDEEDPVFPLNFDAEEEEEAPADEAPKGKKSELANALVALGSGLLGSIASRAMGGYGNQGFAAGFKGAADYQQKERDEAQKLEQALELAQAKKREEQQKKPTFKPEMVEYIVPSTGQRGWGIVDYNSPAGQQFKDRFSNPLPQDAVPMKSERGFVGEGGTFYTYQPGTGAITAPRVQGAPAQAPQPSAGQVTERARGHGLQSGTEDLYRASRVGTKEIDELDKLKATRTPQAEKEYARLVKEYNDRLKTGEKRGYEEGEEKKKITREAVKPRQDKLSKVIAYYNQFLPLLSDLKNTKDPEVQRIKANSMAKLINTIQTASSDAVGAEEVGRLLPETKYNVANFFGPGAPFGTDIPGFIRRMDDTMKSMGSYIQTEADAIEVPAGFPKGGFPGRYINYTSKKDIIDLTNVGDRFLINGVLFERTQPDQSGNFLRKVQQ